MTNSRLSLYILSFVACLAARAGDLVRLEPVPEGGMQPQVCVGADGTIHLIYLKGRPGACDVRYTFRASGAGPWEAPITVNSEANTAIALGTIRGAQLACGKDNSLHVIWNGPQRPSPAGSGTAMDSPLWYSRKLGQGRAFEPQQNIISGTIHLDGGASIAANANGVVYLVWHATESTRQPGEVNRQVYVRKSTDNGATFGSLLTGNADYSGVCACCSLKAFATVDGNLVALYRAARSITKRDVTLLTSRDGGQCFSHVTVQPWKTGACPMSSMTIANAGKKIQAAWETEGKIYTAALGGNVAPVAVSGDRARHPSLAVDGNGEILVAWSVGTAWQKGGDLGWVVLDASGRATSESGREQGVPVWSFPTAYADSSHHFVILH